MDQIKATLYSKTDPALGSVTIQFPIHRKEYDRVLEQLKPLGIGSPLDQDRILHQAKKSLLWSIFRRS